MTVTIVVVPPVEKKMARLYRAVQKYMEIQKTQVEEYRTRLVS